MGVDVPDLDDRTYEELLEDARKRLPVLDDEWTDHNVHDPGITVLELLAWLAESYRYQLDQIEDRHRRKYLELLGVTPDPPRAATANVRVTPAASVAGERVPRGTRLVADDGQTERPFETTRTTPVTDAAVAKVVTETPAGRTDHTPAAASTGTYFHAFGETAPVGSTLYLGFDRDPFPDDTGSLSLHVDFHDDALPAPATHGDEPVAFEPSVEVAWEYCTDYRAWEWTSAWEPFDVTADTTDALYGSGFVELAHPGPDRWQGVDRHAHGVLDTETSHAWIRVRLTTAGYEVPPQLDRIRTNVVPVTNRADHGSTALTRPDGASETTARPHQRFAFPHAPVLDAEITVGGERWEPVPDFDASDPTDTHYRLDATAGAVVFGDNVRGAVPEADQRVVAEHYTSGGGPRGNVPATSDWWFDYPPATDPDAAGYADTVVRDAAVEPLGPGTGGRAAETVEDALRRVTEDLAVPFRTVTAEDAEYVAKHTPGLRFGRAKAIVTDGRSPDDCVDQDALRVVVVPYCPPAIDRPKPSEGFLHAVDCHLKRHRLVTDRVAATGPTYVGVGARVEVETTHRAAASTRAAAVEAALDEFLSPLRGFDGDGWPFGRPVYHSEVYERVGQVDGIDCVNDVELTTDGDVDVTDDAVVIPDTALVAPLDHTVVVQEPGTDCGGRP